MDLKKKNNPQLLVKDLSLNVYLLCFPSGMLKDV